MSTKYNHVKDHERVILEKLFYMGASVRTIAEILGYHRSTIYREIKRNRTEYGYPIKFWGYRCMDAQRKSAERRKEKPYKLQKNAALRKYVFKKLREHWSPGQIEGRLRAENNGKTVICAETIYRYIYKNCGVRNALYGCLRRKHFWRAKHGRKRRKFPEELLINNRPTEIEERKTFGHWECDLMIFKRGIKGNLITLRERKSRYLIAIKNLNKTAQGTAFNIIQQLSKIKEHVKSITYDQGSEFLKYPLINSCIETKSYFCAPSSPHQKGAIENGNGVIRAELPRSYNISGIRENKLSKLVKNINSRPMKCLNYRTPEEVFLELSGLEISN